MCWSTNAHADLVPESRSGEVSYNRKRLRNRKPQPRFECGGVISYLTVTEFNTRATEISENLGEVFLFQSLFIYLETTDASIRPSKRLP